MPSRKNPRNFVNGPSSSGSFPNALRDSRGAPLGGDPTFGSGASSRGGALGAAIGSIGISLTLRSLAIWLAVRVLHSADAVDWQLRWWQAVSLCLLWVVWDALNPHRPPSR